MSPEISNQSLLFLIVFVLVPLWLSYYYQLGLKRDIIWSSIRGALQLFLIGYALNFLFDLPAIQGIPLMLSVMITVASFHAKKKGEGIPRMLSTIVIGLILIEGSVLSLWLLADMIEFTPSQVIPMSGMVIGNSMVAMGLAIERMRSEFKENEGRILAALSLGAKPSQSSKIILQQTLQSSLIPNVDQLKTIGLVQLPGMMTGLILGGVNPVTAIKYQLVISLSIFSAVSISAIYITLMTYKYFYNDRMQLKRMESE
ncbi:ABC transporter permease [Pontibacillus yanchengensis]|uniref:ABC transporter permease n=1 Tax=Pontibacillus yanchengensis TaxID=462910 RepID=UPI00068E985C|nr:iron export ABC transporter permease subunit FetB [Pontibacillus yanchengensis]